MGYTSFANKNADRNIVCWQCEHFNPSRDPAGPPPHAPFKAGGAPAETNYCNGECRKNPPLNSWEFIIGGVPTTPANGYFPFIPLGNTAWCSGFQRAVVPLPAAVVSGATNCTDFDPATWALPEVNNGIFTYRRVPAEDSCWYCEHFQSMSGPGQTPVPGSCRGFCQQAPPMGYSHPIPTGGAPPDPSQQYHWPTIEYAFYKWCSKFERSTRPVPAPPSQNGVPCAPIA